MTFTAGEIWNFFFRAVSHRLCCNDRLPRFHTNSFIACWLNLALASRRTWAWCPLSRQRCRWQGSALCWFWLQYGLFPCRCGVKVNSLFFWCAVGSIFFVSVVLYHCLCFHMSVFSYLFVCVYWYILNPNAKHSVTCLLFSWKACWGTHVCGCELSTHALEFMTTLPKTHLSPGTDIVFRDLSLVDSNQSLLFPKGGCTQLSLDLSQLSGGHPADRLIVSWGGVHPALSFHAFLKLFCVRNRIYWRVQDLYWQGLKRLTRYFRHLRLSSILVISTELH